MSQQTITPQQAIAQTDEMIAIAWKSAFLDLGQSFIWFLLMGAYGYAAFGFAIGMAIAGVIVTTVVLFYRAKGVIKEDDSSGPWRESFEIGAFLTLMLGAILAYVGKITVPVSGVDAFMVLGIVFWGMNVYPMVTVIMTDVLQAPSLSEKLHRYKAQKAHFQKLAEGK